VNALRGVPALTAWLRATVAATVFAVGAALIDSGARLVPEPKIDWASIFNAPVPPVALLNGSSWACVPSAACAACVAGWVTTCAAGCVTTWAACAAGWVTV
jgi:hypothetical protein